MHEARSRMTGEARFPMRKAPTLMLLAALLVAAVPVRAAVPRGPSDLPRAASGEGSGEAGSARPALLAQAEEPPPLPAPEPRRLEPVPDDLMKPREPENPDMPMIEFSAEVLETYMTFLPGRSTRVGVNSFESVLGDYRRKSIAAFVGSYRGYLARLDKLPSAEFTEKGRLEKEALRVHMRSVIRWIDTQGAPFHDPNFYVDESVGAVQSTFDRDENMTLKRAEHLMARLSLFRYFFTVARENLESCPRAAVRRAIMRLRSAGPLFQASLMEEFRVSGHPDVTHSGPVAAAAAWKEVVAFADWLEKERLPKATAAVPLGGKGWLDWLAGQETAGGLTAAQVASAAEADLAKQRDLFARTAAALEPKQEPAALVAQLEAAQLEPEAARNAAINVIGELWSWLAIEKLVDPPTEETITVRETPAFRRRDVPVRTDLPGAYGGREAPSFLELGAPDPGWPPPVMVPWLASYGRYFLPGALMREVYPGRFTAWQLGRTTRIRACKAVSYPTMSEGWPLYAEELAVKGGFGASEKRIMAAGLLDLIRADARLAASVRLHAMGMTAPEAATWLASAGYWPRDVASIEVERLLADPDAAAPALGRLELLALRDDVAKAKGKAFSAREFHGRLLSLGVAPVSALRQVLFPGSGTDLLGAAK